MVYKSRHLYAEASGLNGPVTQNPIHLVLHLLHPGTEGRIVAVI